MVLYVDSDAAYLVAFKARSRIASYYYLSDNMAKNNIPRHNSPILVECKTLRQVVSSAAEAETAGVFYAARTSIPIKEFLINLGHPQPPTPIKTDNSTTHGFAYQNIQQRKSKSWDMQFHWLRDREFQKHFKLFWESGLTNKADYFTKHWPILHHRQIRPTYYIDR